MSLFDSLSGLLTADNIGAIAGSLGSDKGKTQSAVSAALPALIAALAANTSSKPGRKSLNKALKKDHDGGILSDLGGFLGGSAGQSGAGGAILGHIFGTKQPAVQDEVAKKSGLDAGDVAKVMATLAPVVMGYLGKKKREEHLTSKQIARQLAEDRRAIEKRPDVQTGWLGMLDQDGDGNALNDIASMAGGLLSSLGKK